MIPDPLHPAIVHFPIVLLLLGAPLAVGAVFWRKWHLPVLAAVVLSLGGFGAIVATWTGENDAEVAGELAGNGEQVLEEHEEWGERARNAGLVAAFLAIVSVALSRKSPADRVVAAVSALLAVVAAISVIQAGHYGGRAVYKFGAGVNAAAGNGELGRNALKDSPATKDRKDDDED